MGRKIFFKKSDFLGSRFSRSRAGKKIHKKDTAGIIDKPREEKAVFKKLKKYSADGIVTKKEARKAFAELKYESGDGLKPREVRALAKELGLKNHLINRKAYASALKEGVDSTSKHVRAPKPRHHFGRVANEPDGKAHNRGFTHKAVTQGIATSHAPYVPSSLH